MKDKKVIVAYNNGSVAPQYAYRYKIVFSENTAVLEIFKGFDTEEKSVFTETKKINALVFEQLILGLSNLKIFDKDSPEIGGSQRNIEITNGSSIKFFIKNDDFAGINLFNRFLYLYDSDFLNIINTIINH
ncbi:hypothetical protein [Chryseobacterium sp.]|uniref:hypothetical protein n=1 Tax=Chryseobacterium sp. TaxID=1871047 RepID=UPI0028A21F9B|nr:hypothetical protein [Chryseobacterium sp.]